MPFRRRQSGAGPVPYIWEKSVIRAVVFDFNGVIANDEHLHLVLFAEQLATQGITLTEELYNERYLGFDDRGCFMIAMMDHNKPCDPNLLQTLIDRKAVRYLERAAQELVFFPGVVECAERLSAKVPLVVCSGALRAEIELALEILNIRHLFQGIVSAEDTEACKPDPEGYSKALDLLRQSIPDLEAEQTVAVEDSLAGIAAAKAAGMHVVALPNSYPVDKLQAEGPSSIVNNLSSFSHWVLERI